MTEIDIKDLLRRGTYVVYESKYCKLYARVTGVLYNKSKQAYLYKLDMPQFKKDYYTREQLREATDYEKGIFY